MNIKDQGVRDICRTHKYLEDFDIGGTDITSEVLRDIVTICISLRKVNISGCKRLNASDDQILKKYKINVESGEDIFRFHLFPHPSSELPKITTSVLKTRGTLSMNKVFKYLIKKLQTDKAIEEIPESQQPDSVVEILCNGALLSPLMQLKNVRQNHWPHQDRLLELHYRLKEVPPVKITKESLLGLSRIGSIVLPTRFYPKKPPMWVPSRLAPECMRCQRPFSLWSRRLHHCRACGKCFCHQCSSNNLPLPEYGYIRPVRHCLGCSQIHYQG